jgi:hypothetical protein
MSLMTSISKPNLPFRRRVKTIVWVLSALLGICVTSATAGAETEPDAETEADGPPDCRYAPRPRPENVEAGEFTHQFLPHTSLFRQPIADMKAPRFYGSARATHYRTGPLVRQEKTGGDFVSGIAGMGARIGLYGWRDGRCNGLQVGLSGAVFSEFNLSTISENLLNSDFIAALPISWRWGRWSGQVRLFHQSSHLGDEYLLNNGPVERDDLTIEAFDVMLSYAGRWWRLYGGGGFIIFSPVDLGHGFVQAGGEIRAHFWKFGNPSRNWFIPVAGVDVQSWQARDWALGVSAKAGLEMGARAPVLHRVRLLAGILGGYTPFGQFFRTSEVTSWGVEAQIEF